MYGENPKAYTDFGDIFTNKENEKFPSNDYYPDEGCPEYPSLKNLQ